MDGHSHRAAQTAHLERGQLVIDRSQPLERMAISRRTAGVLWALRIGVTVLGALVLYTFAAQLG